MAKVPLPVGISVLLREVAEGIGVAAKTLPAASRSEAGTLALRTAKVRLEFEMARTSTETAGTAGIGPVAGVALVTGLGVSTRTGETVSRATSRGTIDLDIVAVAPAIAGEAPAEGSNAPIGGPPPAPPPPPPREPPVPSPPGPAFALSEELLAVLEDRLAGLSASKRRRGSSLLTRARLAFRAGDEREARALVLQLQPLFEPGR